MSSLGVGCCPPGNQGPELGEAECISHVQLLTPPGVLRTRGLDWEMTSPLRASVSRQQKEKCLPQEVAGLFSENILTPGT